MDDFLPVTYLHVSWGNLHSPLIIIVPYSRTRELMLPVESLSFSRAHLKIAHIRIIVYDSARKKYAITWDFTAWKKTRTRYLYHPYLYVITQKYVPVRKRQNAKTNFVPDYSYSDSRPTSQTCVVGEVEICPFCAPKKKRFKSKAWRRWTTNEMVRPRTTSYYNNIVKPT